MVDALHHPNWTVSSPTLTNPSISSRPRRYRLGKPLALIVGLALIVVAVFYGAAWFVRWQAVRALAGHDPERALDWLARAEMLGGGDASAEFLRARATRKLGRLDETREHLLRAWKLGYPPQSLEREQWLVQASTGQLQLAEPHFSTLLKDPRDDGAEICEAFVIGYLIVYRLVDAGRVLDAWEADFPEDPLPHYYRARIHLIESNWQKAETALRRTLAREPGNVLAAVTLAETLMELQKPGEALELFSLAQSSRVEGIRARIGMAGCLRSLFRPDEARSILKQILAESPDNPDALYELGQDEMDAGNYSLAAELLERADFRGPKYAKILYAGLYARMRALNFLNRKDEARQLNDRLQAMRAAQVRAEQLIEQLNNSASDPELRFEIGKAYLNGGLETEGLLWLKSVLQFDSRHERALRAIAEHEAQHPPGK